MGHIATLLANRSQGSLSSSTEPNLKEQANVITLRNKNQLDQGQVKSADGECAKEFGESLQMTKERQKIT